MFEDLRDALSESWQRFCSLDLFTADWVARWILASVAIFLFLMVFAWKIMLPFILLAVGVTLYLRRSRDRSSL